MEAVETFMRQCLALGHLHEDCDVDYPAVGKKIAAAGNRLSTRVHPMIREICSIAAYLATPDADWQEDEAKRAAWEALCRLVKDYADNRWEPTVWTLIAIYTITEEGRTASASVSVRVTRASGKTEIETASDTLRSIVINLTEHIHPKQTDEWYLHNLARMLPPTVRDLTLMDTTLTEQLTQSRW